MRDPLVVVGVVGPARSGKDTVARILELHGGFTRIALADPIKDIFDRLGGPGRETYKELGGFQALTIRRAWQLLGTESREEIGRPLLWVDVALATIRYAEAHHARRRARFVIPDVRYAHEVLRLSEGVEAMGGTFETWRADRPGLTGVAESDHSSETEHTFIVPSVVIPNAGTIADLDRIVRAEMETLIGDGG